MTMSTSNIEKMLEKDRSKMISDLERQKKDFANQIKNLKKEDVLPKAPEKITLWKRIIKVLMG